MKKQNINQEEVALLRQKAEKQLNSSNWHGGITTSLSETDALKLIHELGVHQIELEMQNEELIIANQRIIELAKEKYKELYDFAPSGYLSISKDGEICELNLAAARMLGKERSKLMRKIFALFVSPETLPVFNLFIQQVFNSHNKQTCEAVIVTEGNLPIYVNINGILSQDDNIGLLTLTDITERKQIEFELLKEKEKAQESDRLKSAFLANMSHEIRTPMNGILGFADLLKRFSLSDEQQHEYIDIIEKSGVRMLNIINDIIDISKIEAGLMKVDFNESNINDQIAYVCTLLKPEAEAKGTVLTYINPLPTKAAIIYTDCEKVYAILTNLVKNAIKFTVNGSIEVGYRLKTDRELNLLEFYIKDTGIGISKCKQGAIFERFIQADSEKKMSQQGAGLGLSISKSYVEMLGGIMWVESEQGKGSTFIFTLPYNAKTDMEHITHDMISVK